MSQAESPNRLNRDVTVDDVRQLMGASTPHFALQLRNRIARLIDPLPAGHPARELGELEIARLTQLGFGGETRGHAAEASLPTLKSVTGTHDVGGPGSETPEPETTASH